MITSNSNEGLPESEGATETQSDSRPIGPQALRYSLREMLTEVESERKLSDLGREVIDQSEIKSLFKAKSRKKKRVGNSDRL